MGVDIRNHLFAPGLRPGWLGLRVEGFGRDTRVTSRAAVGWKSKSYNCRQDLHLENGARQRQILALTVLHVPCSLGSGCRVQVQGCRVNLRSPPSPGTAVERFESQ